MATIFRGARAPVDAGSALTRTTASDIQESLPGSHVIYNVRVQGRITEREHREPRVLARRAPTIKGKLVGPLLAQEAALAAQTHLEWPRSGHA